MQNLNNLSKMTLHATNTSDILKVLTPYAKLYLKDFGTSINFANNTITNFGYGLNNLAMVGYTRNDGTVSGGVTIVDGAMKFNGTNGEVNTGVGLNLRDSCICGFISFDATPTLSSYIISNRRSGTNMKQSAWVVRGSSNQIGIQTRDSVNNPEKLFTPSDINNFFLAQNFKSDGTSDIYIDGIFVGSTDIGGGDLDYGDGRVWYIGVRGNSASNYSNQKQHTLQFYNRNLTQAEITQIHQAGRNAYSPISSGLVAQYSGRNFAGTTSAPTTIFDTRYITQVSATDTRTVLENLGAQYINYGGVMFSASDSYSVLANYRLDSTATSQRIISRMTGSSSSTSQPTLVAYSTGTTTSRFFLRNTVPTSFAVNTGTITTGRHQVTPYYNQPSGDFGIYRNGVVEGVDVFTGTMQSGSNNTILFAQSPSTSDQNLIGGLQSLMVLDRSVTTNLFKAYFDKVKV